LLQVNLGLSFHTDIFNILLLPPGALLLIFFKMASVQEKAQCVLWLGETVQWMFRAQYGKNPHDVRPIKSWKTKFLETRSVHKGKSSSSSLVSEERVEAVQTAFTQSSQKSIRRASLELQMPKSTAHKVVCKRLKLFV
jgi:hypothetical protein